MPPRDENRAAEEPPEVERLVDALVEGDLAKYLLDSVTANELIKEISAETSLPRPVVRIAFKLLAPMLVKAMEATAGRFGRRLLSRSADGLARLPGYSLIASSLLKLRSKFEKDVARRQQLDAILAGARRPTDVEHAEGLSQELRLGLRQLAELDEMQAHIDMRFGEILVRLNSQPPLTLKLLAQNETNRLKFGAQRVPFVGRQAELERLGEFLHAPARFAWWLVTGSGGHGKSRLALELCLRAGTAWRAGFLAETSTFDAWDTWQPEGATLIVVDYVATPAKTRLVRRMIESMRDRQEGDPLDAPVRLLLLERSKQPVWWDELITGDTTGYKIEECQFAPEPVALGPASEDELWQHIVEVLRPSQTTWPDREETLAALARIDPERRPLFAAFAADALSASGNIRGWDQERLLRDVLRREREKHWQPAGVTRAYENLLCLVTMAGDGRVPLPAEASTTGSPDRSILANPPAGIELPGIEEFCPTLYEAMTGAPAGQPSDGSLYLSALQPDILGEFFVLEYLKPPHARTTQPARRFCEAAWHLSDSAAWSFAAFLRRAHQDFERHGTLPLLVVPPASGRAAQNCWAIAANVMFNFQAGGHVAEEAQEVLDALEGRARNDPNDPVLQRCFINTAMSWATVLAFRNRFDCASEIFETLDTFTRDETESEFVRFSVAQTSYWLLHYMRYCSKREDYYDLVILWFKRVNSLTMQYPHDAQVRRYLVKTCNEMVIICSLLHRYDEAEKYVERIGELFRAHPDVEVGRSLAHAAHELLDYLHNFEQARAIFDWVEALLRPYLNDSEINESLDFCKVELSIISRRMASSAKADRGEYGATSMSTGFDPPGECG